MYVEKEGSKSQQKYKSVLHIDLPYFSHIKGITVLK